MGKRAKSTVAQQNVAAASSGCSRAAPDRIVRPQRSGNHALKQAAAEMNERQTNAPWKPQPAASVPIVQNGNAAQACPASKSWNHR